ncbi:uncharacterized protein METZ01_LOCUS200504 [marine metagenome]|uniref:Uncharacterized protein n=1 Tax=marine metagenome TaxID=408172 RepID=A0A382EAI9_9ZZZZ
MLRVLGPQALILPLAGHGFNVGLTSASLATSQENALQ